MRFFRIDPSTNAVEPTPELLLVPPFMGLWSRKDRETALKEIAYVAFMENLEDDNPYRDTTDSEKEHVVKTAVFGDATYQPDELVLEARKVISERYTDTTSYRYYEAAKKAAEALRSYMDNVDFEERTKSLAMVHDPNKTQSAIKNTVDTLRGLKEMRKRVITESFEVSKQVKDRETGYYED